MGAARQVYLSTLESTRSATLAFASRVAPNEAAAAGLSNACAGALASLVTQSVIVPIDVVSQKLMVAGGRTGHGSLQLRIVLLRISPQSSLLPSLLIKCLWHAPI